jgi:transposase
MKKSTKLRRVESSVQPELFSGLAAAGTKRPRLIKKFVDPDPEFLRVGEIRLRDFLESVHADLPLKIRDIIREIDYTNFTKKYDLNGRAPYHPAIIMGLVIYGFLKNQGSLRQLESLATTDLGAHWITGGIFPDHTTIGRFLQLHADTITHEFFEDLTRRLIKKAGTPSHDWAIDGTIIESFGSRYQTLKLEAAKQLLAELEADECCDAPDIAPDSALIQPPKSLENEVTVPGKETISTKKRPNLDKLRQAIELGEFSDARQRDNGSKSKSSASTVRMCITDPEAIVLRTKRHTFAPSYVVSLVTGMNRIIYAFCVDQFSESESLDQLFAQASRVAGPPKNLLMDTGYFHKKVAELAKSLDAIMICPPKKSTLEEPEDLKFFSKDFHFQFVEGEEKKDDYLVCPAGEKLTTSKSPRKDDRRGTEDRVFSTKESICTNCNLRSQCTPTHRKVTRSDLLEELRQNYADEANQKLYQQRKHTVEPVFGAIKIDYGLNKLRRLGKRGGLLDVCLIACAHNIKQTIKLVPEWPFFAAISVILRGLWLIQLALCHITSNLKYEHRAKLSLLPN